MAFFVYDIDEFSEDYEYSFKTEIWFYNRSRSKAIHFMGDLIGKLEPIFKNTKIYACTSCYSFLMFNEKNGEALVIIQPKSLTKWIFWPFIRHKMEFHIEYLVPNKNLYNKKIAFSIAEAVDNVIFAMRASNGWEDSLELDDYLIKSTIK